MMLGLGWDTKLIVLASWIIRQRARFLGNLCDKTGPSEAWIELPASA